MDFTHGHFQSQSRFDRLTQAQLGWLLHCDISKVLSLTENPSICHYPDGSQETLLDFCTMQANTQQKSHGVMYY